MNYTQIGIERATRLRDALTQVESQTGDWRVALEEAQSIADDLVREATPPERVIFRRFPHDGTVVALFPDQYNERNGKIMSYAHNGQHSETYPDFGDTKPCEWHDYSDLYAELVGQGYTNLKSVKRFGKLGRK